MDRIIEVKVKENLLTKDNRNAGVRGEANAKSLRISFDTDWDGYAKSVTFWNALGLNPVRIELTANRLENPAKSTRTYLCPIPGEAMEEAGLLVFVIDGAVCFHQFGGNTKGTPKAYGKTNHGAGMILTYSGGGYGAQVAFCAGAYPFVRVIDNGKIGAWQQMLNTENMKVEYIKNINPVTTGCASLLEYLAKRYDEHPVIFGSVTDFSDLPSGVTLGQAQINLCGGLLTVTINALDGVWYRATNSLSAWTGSWKKATMT